MLAYAFDRPPQSTVVILISADPTLAYALSMLRLRNHNVVVVKPSGSKPDLLMQASLCFDWNEEIIQEYGAESDRLAQDMSKLRVSKTPAKEGVVDDRSPASQMAPSDRSPSTNTCRKLGEVVLEDYFPVDSESWHTAPDTGTREEKAKAIEKSYYPPTPDTIKTRTTPTELKREPTSPVPPPFSKPVFRSLKRLKKKTPVGFRPLVEVLYTMREEGYVRPLRSSVGLQLIQMDPKVYERVGYTRFAQYASMAVTLGIAELGGRDGKAWISFHPTFENV